MKKLLILFISVIPMLALSQSQIVKEDIEIIEDFHTVNVNSRYTVYIKQSNETKIEVRALKEVMDISKFSIADGELNINIKREEKDKSIWEQIDDIKIAPKLDVYISMQNVQALNVNGNGKIISENSISSDDLSLSLSGPGSLDVDIKGNKLTIDHSGGGLMKIKGYASDATIELSGFGKIEAYELDLKEAKAELTGRGDIEISVKENLNAIVNGEGKISFKGNTRQVTKKEYGLGKVERAY